MGISVLTIVRNRDLHLAQLVEGLRRSERHPYELIIVDMSDEPVAMPSAGFPIRIDRFETDGLPLAAARNRAASLAKHDQLIFLDVDCIPLRNCIGLLSDTLLKHEAILCADIRYLGPHDARGSWEEADCLRVDARIRCARFPRAGCGRKGMPGSSGHSPSLCGDRRSRRWADSTKVSWVTAPKTRILVSGLRPQHTSCSLLEGQSPVTNITSPMSHPCSMSPISCAMRGTFMHAGVDGRWKGGLPISNDLDLYAGRVMLSISCAYRQPANWLHHVLSRQRGTW